MILAKYLALNSRQPYSELISLPQAILFSTYPLYDSEDPSRNCILLSALSLLIKGAFSGFFKNAGPTGKEAGSYKSLYGPL